MLNQYYIIHGIRILTLSLKLEELYKLGGEEFLKRVDNYNKYPVFYSNKLYCMQNASNCKMFKLLLRFLIRLLGRRFSRLFLTGKWSLFFAFGEGLSSSFWKFKVITSPEDRFFADPFIIMENNKYKEFTHG